MEKVLTVQLNGRAYLIDAGGYEALRAYLDHASAQLQNNPDRAEILADLEQAIGDKCAPYLNAHKNVVARADIEAIVKVMGPVDTGDVKGGANTEQVAGAAVDRGGDTTTAEPPPKRLHRVHEGAMISGICNGLAAYFGLDPVLIRIAAILLIFLTGGGAIVAYLILIFVIPRAKTDEQRAVAYGKPFNARTVVARARQQAADIAKRSNVQETWKDEQQFLRDRWQGKQS